MNSVLIIGGGEGQVPLIDAAHNLGLQAVVVSPKGNYRGRLMADCVIEEDIRFPDRIVTNHEFGNKNIVAVVSDQLDEAVPIVAKLAEHFNVPGIGYDVAVRFKDKYVMRIAASRLGVAVPKCVFVEKIADLQKTVEGLKYPVMIKPVDSASSRGVYKACNLDELSQYYLDSRRYSSVGVIVEEYISGREYVVEGFTVDYHTKNLIVGHRDYFDVPGAFIPCATVFRDADSATDSLEERLKELNLKIVNGFGLKFGLTHAEYIYNEVEDKIYLVEIAARGGGVCISSDLVPAACGVDSISLYMRTALGEQIPPVKLHKGAAAYFCYMLPEGNVASIDGVAKMQAVSGFIRAVLGNVEIGMHIAAARDKYSRKGPILVKGETKNDCYAAIEKIKKFFRVKVQTIDGMKESYWS